MPPRFLYIALILLAGAFVSFLYGIYQFFRPETPMDPVTIVMLSAAALVTMLYPLRNSADILDLPGNIFRKHLLTYRRLYPPDRRTQIRRGE